jgi:hypothetical protein
MHFALEDVARHRAADQRGRDIVEEARQHEYDGEQRQPALPAVRQERWHFVRHAAVFEVPRQDREAHQQQEQVGEDHGLVLHVQREPGEPGAKLEARENQLVEYNCGKTGERDLQGLVVEHRDAEQRQREQDEIDRNAENEHRRRCRPCRRRGRECRRGHSGRKSDHRDACAEPARALHRAHAGADAQASGVGAQGAIYLAHGPLSPDSSPTSRLMAPPEGPGLEGRFLIIASGRSSIPGDRPTIRRLCHAAAAPYLRAARPRVSFACPRLRRLSEKV